MPVYKCSIDNLAWIKNKDRPGIPLNISKMSQCPHYGKKGYGFCADCNLSITCLAMSDSCINCDYHYKCLLYLEE